MENVESVFKGLDELDGQSESLKETLHALHELHGHSENMEQHSMISTSSMVGFSMPSMCSTVQAQSISMIPEFAARSAGTSTGVAATGTPRSRGCGKRLFAYPPISRTMSSSVGGMGRP